jgi:putative Holliday junction resolvase
VAGALSLADFAEAVPHGRLLGLDVGTKTIGLATCDAGWSFATPAETIRRTKFTADLATLKAFVVRHSIAGLVVGLPLSLDGTDSPRTQSVRAFARNLAPLDLPILLWDERWSTVAVERTMIEADMSRAKRAEKIDAHAAAHILQGAIDALVNLPPAS